MTRKPGGGGRMRELMRSDTGRAGGMAVAVIAGNVIALALTGVFARVLHAKGYGSFSALMSTFIILMGPGPAPPTPVARGGRTGVARGGPHPGRQGGIGARGA